jgi:hypothetical protein
MTRITIVNDSNEITLNSSWVHSAKFNSIGRLVDEKGTTVNPNFKGRMYRCIDKRERTFSVLERFGRGCIGVCAAICTIGFALLFKPVRELFTKSKEHIRFALPVLPSNVSAQERNLPPEEAASTPKKQPQETKASNTTEAKGAVEETVKPEHEKSEQELQQGISLSATTLSKIQNCMSNILNQEPVAGIHFYTSQQAHRVFELDSDPGLIFKMSLKKSTPTSDNSTKARYESMIKAQTVVRTHQLGLLHIPNAKFFTVDIQGKKVELIAEKKLDINPEGSAQEQHYYEYADRLNEAIRQLAVFICKTGFSDVEWRNIPILNTKVDGGRNTQIALIDLEEMASSSIGLFGKDRKRRGLVRCVTGEQGKIIESVAKQYCIQTNDFAEAAAKRREEVEDYKKLKEYYAKHHIVSGYEPIRLDIASIEFPEYPEKAKKLRELTEQIIHTMNDQILKASQNRSVKGRRSIFISKQTSLFKEACTFIIDPQENPQQAVRQGQADITFLDHIVKKLTYLNLIFKLIDRHPCGYLIQA